MEEHPFSLGPTQNSEYTEFSEANKNKNGCAREEIYFLCICTILVILTLILNALTHFYIACCVLLCMQYNVNLCLFSSWFVEEAKVANND